MCMSKLATTTRSSSLRGDLLSVRIAGVLGRTCFECGGRSGSSISSSNCCRFRRYSGLGGLELMSIELSGCRREGIMR